MASKLCQKPKTLKRRHMPFSFFMRNWSPQLNGIEGRQQIHNSRPATNSFPTVRTLIEIRLRAALRRGAIGYVAKRDAEGECACR